MNTHASVIFVNEPETGMDFVIVSGAASPSLLNNLKLDAMLSASIAV